MVTRRQFLGHSAMVASSMLALRGAAFAAQSHDGEQSPPQPQQTLLQSMRVAATSMPIRSARISDTIYLLLGVGANIVVLVGPDGKLLIDSGMATAAPRLLDTLSKLAPHPVKLLINTSWLFDHTDGNAALHLAGAFILAQENTRARLSVPQKLPLFNLDLPPAPVSALPQVTFADQDKLYFDNDALDLIHIPNASTDSDVIVHFANANVIHAGELWYNRAWPIIDTTSGGTINGMIQGVDQILQLCDDRTKIIPSHGVAGTKANLAAYRQTLTSVANQVEKLKIAGQSLNQVIAAPITSGLDSEWSLGQMTSDMFITAVYNTL